MLFLYAQRSIQINYVMLVVFTDVFRFKSIQITRWRTYECRYDKGLVTQRIRSIYLVSGTDYRS